MTTFKNIYRFANLSGLLEDMIKPTPAKARFAEISMRHCECFATDKSETKFRIVLPKLACKEGRQHFYGYIFLVSFHPSLRLGTCIVEGQVGKDIFEEMEPLVSKSKELPWVCRVYELDTATGIGG